MAKQVINDGETGLVVRGKINDNFDELYAKDSAQDATIANKADTVHDHDSDYEPKNSNIQTHIIATNNPHSTSKATIGLDAVDNTADSDKPISDATQSALDGKAATTHNHDLDYEPKDSAIQTHINSAHAPADANNYQHPATHPSTMITGLGSAATRYVGTSAGEVIVLEAGGKLPSVDGSNLTGIPNELTSDQQAALDSANLPSSGNPIATIADVNGVADGDMKASTYDPTNQRRDAFKLDYMVEGADAKIMTAAERTAIATNSGKTGITILEQQRISDATDHVNMTSANPHGVTKEAIGLGNVDNTSDATKPVAAHTHIPDDITGIGSAALRDTGVIPHSVIMLDDTGKLPAVDASQLLNLVIPKDTTPDYISTADPTGTENPSKDWATFLNSTTGDTFTCIDRTTDANVWENGYHIPSSYVVDSEVLTRTNTDPYVPTSSYNPATMQYVDDAVAAGGGGSGGGASSLDVMMNVLERGIADEEPTIPIENGLVYTFSGNTSTPDFLQTYNGCYNTKVLATLNKTYIIAQSKIQAKFDSVFGYDSVFSRLYWDEDVVITYASSGTYNEVFSFHNDGYPVTFGSRSLEPQVTLHNTSGTDRIMGSYMSDDGLTFIAVGMTGILGQYTFTEAKNFSAATCSITRTNDVSASISGSVRDLYCSSDGTNLVIVTTSGIYTFVMGTPFDISTVGTVTAYTAATLTANWGTPQSSINGFSMSRSGTFGLAIWSTNTWTVYHFRLSTAWDFSTFYTPDADGFLLPGSYLYGPSYMDEGKAFVGVGWSYGYFLETAWNPSTVAYKRYTYDSVSLTDVKISGDDACQTAHYGEGILALPMAEPGDFNTIDLFMPMFRALPYDYATKYWRYDYCAFVDNGNRFIITQVNRVSGAEAMIFLFKLTVPYDISTAIDGQSIDIGTLYPGSTTPKSFKFLADGKSFYCYGTFAGTNNSIIRVYLPNPYDFSDIYIPAAPVASDFAGLDLLRFYSGGTSCQYGYNVYTLGTPYDLTDTPTSGASATGIFMASGTKRYESENVYTADPPYTDNLVASAQQVLADIGAISNCRPGRFNHFVFANGTGGELMEYYVVADGFTLEPTNNKLILDTGGNAVNIVGFSADGKFLYYHKLNTIYQLPLTDPFMIGSAEASVGSVAVTGLGSSFQIANNGLTVFGTTAINSTTLNEYDLSTAWDISTMSTSVDRTSSYPGEVSNLAFIPSGYATVYMSHSTYLLYARPLIGLYDTSTSEAYQSASVPGSMTRVAVGNTVLGCTVINHDTSTGYAIAATMTPDPRYPKGLLDFTTEAIDTGIVASTLSVTITLVCAFPLDFSPASLNVSASRSAGETWDAGTLPAVAKKVGKTITLTTAIAFTGVGQSNIIVKINYDKDIIAALRGLVLQWGE